MFCIYCGTSNPNDASFCSHCGKATDAPANPPIPAEIPQRAPDRTQESINSGEPSRPPMPFPAPPAPSPEQQPAPYQRAAAKSKAGLWIFVGFAACLVIVVAVAVGFQLNRPASGSDTPTVSSAPSTPPASVPSVDDSPAQASAPVQAPPAPPPPAAPQNPIVGDWKTTTLIGDTVLHFGDDGRYTIKSALVSEAGVYVFSMSDGTLRLQQDAIFSHDIVVWSCQLSSNSLSVVDPQGAGHVYTRIQ
jgi:zinc ribbon protein